MTSYTSKDFKSRWQAKGEQRRRAIAAELLDIYSHDWEYLLDDELKKLFLEQNYNKIKDRSDTSLNLLKWACEQMAIYAKPAIRTVGGLQEGLEPYLAGGTLDMAMDGIATLLFCCRELALRPMVVGEKEKQRIVVDVVTPNQFSVIPNDSDPLAIDAIIIELPQSNNSKARYSVWTQSEHYLFNSSWTMLPMPNGEPTENRYRICPYLPIHAVYPTRGFWHSSESYGLRDATLQTGVQKTDFNHLRHHQSFKQMAILGDGVGDITSAIVDPTYAIAVKGHNADVKVLDMQANLPQALDTILSSASATMNTYGFRPEAIRGTIDASSGYALKIKNHSLELARDRYRRAWRLWESMHYATSQRVWEVDTGKTLPSGEFDVQHASLQPEANPIEMAELGEKLQRLGWSRKRIYIEVFNKNEEWIKQNEKELAEEQGLVSLDSQHNSNQPEHSAL